LKEDFDEDDEHFNLEFFKRKCNKSLKRFKENISSFIPEQTLSQLISKQFAGFELE